MSIASNYAKLDRRLATLGGWLQSPGLFLVRLWWGWSFFQTGKSKLMNLDKTTAFFESLQIPMPKLSAITAGSVECIGGLLLLVGLFSRAVSVPLMFTMVTAYVTAHTDAWNAIISNTDKFTGAKPFLFLFAALLVFAFGPGRLSLDALFFGSKNAPK
ncbi:MAG: DoxX family protein [Opitutaceae bacterium]